LSFLRRIFGGTGRREALAPLYRAVVARGRDPYWYRDGAVPDTLDGRFDVLAAVLAIVLVRLDADGEPARGPSVLLTEIFIDDMDATLRQIGIGDYVVGKHVGRMMAALGGRLAAFRAGDTAAAVRRNLFHDSPPGEEVVGAVAARLDAFAAALAATPLAALLAGELA
jgi:cytochrome b pre-mRNA-processing protein 3